MNDRVPERDLSRLAVPRWGQLVETGDRYEPYRLVDADGAVVAPVAVFFQELLAAGKTASTVRSYGMDLLRWCRFLHAVEVPWDRATRVDARDFSCWIQLTVKPRVTAAKRRPARTIGAPNPVTGKASPGLDYAPPTVAHSETVLRKFYDLHRDAGSGPLLNPFPLDLARRSGRAHAHHNPMDAWAPEGTGRYRPTVPRRIPRSIPDEWFNSLFAALRSNRGQGNDRVLDLQRSPGLGADRRPAMRRRPWAAADQRCAEGLPSTAAGAGPGRCVRMAAALPAGVARAGAERSDASLVVDATTFVSAADLPRRPPHVRADKRNLRRGLDPSRPSPQRRRPHGARPGADADRRAVGPRARASDHHRESTSRRARTRSWPRCWPTTPGRQTGTPSRCRRLPHPATTRKPWTCCSGGLHDHHHEALAPPTTADRECNSRTGPSTEQRTAGTVLAPLRRGMVADDSAVGGRGAAAADGATRSCRRPTAPGPGDGAGPPNFCAGCPAPGDTWQLRWKASCAEDIPGADWTDLPAILAPEWTVTVV